MKEVYKYPFSRRWVLLSLFLSICSFFLALIILGVKIYLFLFLALPQVLFFTAVKARLYKKLDATDLNPLLYFGGGEQESSLYVTMLIMLVFFGFALPFLLLFLLEPVMWFVSLLSFVFGINMPELILFFLAMRRK
ncbi:MAG: hypothetical protein QW670_05280 [Candidatus Bathyarchaeia archaeon]